MTTNVKPGDRAVVVRATHPSNLGKIVNVIEQILPTKVLDTMVYNVAGQMVIARPDDGVVWVVESLGSPFVGVRKNGEEVAVMVEVPSSTARHRRPRRGAADRPIAWRQPRDLAPGSGHNRGF